jgi:hypothetical protein
MTEQKAFFSFKYDEPAPKQKRRSPKRLRAGPLPPLTIGQILEWADAHHARTGKWPNINSGLVRENRNEKWESIDSALRRGRRGLPLSRGLAPLLLERRGVPIWNRVPPLTEALILKWADAHKRRTGAWPTGKSGAVADAPGEYWYNIQQYLNKGSRGLPGGSSIVRLLSAHRGIRNSHNLTGLTVEQILEWADAYRSARGSWPTKESGEVADSAGETWRGIDSALSSGSRSLPGGSTLVQLLAEERGRRNQRNGPSLTVKQILGWADSHLGRTGHLPNIDSGPIHESVDDNWLNVDKALRLGRRGLPGGTSLARLLTEHFGKRNHRDSPLLTEEQILGWADAHFRRTGRWPHAHLGPVEGAEGESWSAIDSALAAGRRGLPGGTSVAQLLWARRGTRHRQKLPRLTIKEILCWADAHRRATGAWPTKESGPIAGSFGETWGNINRVLRRGGRSLRGGSTLARLLEEKRGHRNRANLPSITVKQLLGWADAHFRRTGRWPDAHSGPIEGAEGETWEAINATLIVGRRGLPGGTTLFRFLVQHRRKSPIGGKAAGR